MTASSFAPETLTRPTGRLLLPDTSTLAASVLAQAVMTTDGRPIVLIDMDGVIAKWLPGVIRICGQLAAEAGIPNPLTLEHASWEMMTGDPVRDEIVAAAMNHPDLYRLLEPEDGAVEAVKTLQAEVGEVLFASTAMLSNPMAHSAKAHWTDEIYGDGWHEKLILTHDKTTLRGVVLADDKQKITGRMKPLWQHIVFDRNYNQDTPGPRIHDWSERSIEIIAKTVETRMHQLAAG
jgi:5'-nucleotidase